MTINIKTPNEIEKMRLSGKKAASVLEMIDEYIKPGITTDQINTICHDFIVNELDSIPAPLNYQGFPKSTCTSVNHVVCHGIPSNKKLKNGDIINLDIAIIHNEYYGDTSKMFYVGTPTIRAKRLCEITYEALLLAIDIVKPGIKLGDIGHTIQNFAENNHFSVVREFCGHGIGRNFHEDPQVLHYGKPNTGMVLQENMTFTIEPMINSGKRFIKTLSDNWTVVTKDKQLSAQWEHTIAVTKNGCEVLTARENEFST